MRRTLPVLALLLTACGPVADVSVEQDSADQAELTRIDAITSAFSKSSATDDVRAAGLYRDVLLSRTSPVSAYTTLLSIPDASWRVASGALDDLTGDVYALERVAILGSALRQPGTRTRAGTRARAEIIALATAATTASVDAGQALFAAARKFNQLGTAETDLAARLKKGRTIADKRDEATEPPKPGDAEALTLVDRTQLLASAPNTTLGRAIVDAAALTLLDNQISAATLAPLRANPADTLANIDVTLAKLPLSASRDRRLLIALLLQVQSGTAVNTVLQRELTRLSAASSSTATRHELLEIASTYGRNLANRDDVNKLADAYVSAAHGQDVRKAFGFSYEAGRTTVPETNAIVFGCDGNGCRWPVPLYNQNDSAIGDEWFPNGTDDSMLCSAASAAMALAGALVTNPTDHISAALEYFRYGTPAYRINVMALLLGTDPVDGGSVVDLEPLLENGMYYNGVAPDVLVENDNSTLSPSFLKAELRRSPGVIVNYGKYDKVVSQVPGPGFTIHMVSFHRTGGHYYALRGHSGDDFLINNPWYAELRVDSLGALYGAVSWSSDGDAVHITTLPNDESVSYQWLGLQNGNKYRILNRAAAIRNVGM